VITSPFLLALAASGTFKATTKAGAETEGKGLGVEVAIAVAAIVNVVETTLGANVHADVTAVTSLSSQAIETLETAATGGADAGTNAIGGSIALNGVLSESHALVGSGVLLNQSVATPDPNQGISLTAINSTTIGSIVGLDNSGDDAGGGAGIDAGVIANETLATLDGMSKAQGSVSVRTLAFEGVVSISTADAQADGESIAGSGSVYLVTTLTRSSIAPGATVNAHGNVLVTADDQDELDLNAGTFADALGASVSGSVAAGIVQKVTEAFVGNGATVTADGVGTAITTPDGTFDVVFDTGTPLDGQVVTPGFVKGLHDVLKFVFDNAITQFLLGIFVSSPPPDDGSYDGRRRAEPHTVSINGLAVTAVSRDAVATDVSGFTAAIGTAPQLSAAGTYVHNRTSAYIDQNAHINPSTAGASTNQQVFVAAGSDSFQHANARTGVI
jgi:hypothetical protein